MTGPRRHLRLVAIGDDDVNPPPPGVRRRWSAREEALYAVTFTDLTRRGWHAAVAAIEAVKVVERRQAAAQRKDRA